MLGAPKTHAFSISFAVDQRLCLARVGYAGETEVGRARCGLAQDVAEIEQRAQEAGAIDRHVLHVDEVRGRNLKVEGMIASRA